MTVDSRAQAVLEYWFADSIDEPSRIRDRKAWWFGEGDTRVNDRLLEERFGSIIELASCGRLAHWRRTPRERLALILLLDQFRRSVYRGSPAAFTCDAIALELAQDGLATGMHSRLSGIECMFFAMPLQHSESVAAQEQSVRVFSEFAAAQPESLRATFEGFVYHARLHHDIVARFGRFPHRNAILGRSSTAEEAAYLAGGAPAFGQRR